jgi:hypothetical protein
VPPKFTIDAQIEAVETARDRLPKRDRTYEYEHGRLSAALETLKFCRDHRDMIVELMRGGK